MSKPAKQPPAAPSGPVLPANPAGVTAQEPKIKKSEPSSKQSRVIAMLRSRSGTTIAAVMKATGWQQHSVRGFLAGVVRKRLKLKLASKKADRERVYRIDSGGRSKSASRRSKRPSS
jgi:hypothetical protein